MTTTIDLTSLLYRRQFIAGPRPFRYNGTWGSEPFADLHVSFHPDLEVTKVSADTAEVLCLGHIFDPDNPLFGNREILTHLIAHAETFAAFEQAVSRFGGRWLLFARLEDQTRLYPDTGGLKPAFYTSPTEQLPRWIASQPSLLTEAFPLRLDRQILDSFLGASYQNSWPGEITPFAGVRQLLPNHYLDLARGVPRRFWPTQPITPVALDTAAERISTTIINLEKSYGARRRLALPLTAGHDSRTLFACASKLQDRVEPFIINDPETDYYDISVPKRLVRKLGGRLKVLRTQPASNTFWDTYRRNTSWMYWDPADNKTFTFGAYADGWFIVTGHVAEVARCFYYKDGNHPERVTAETLAEISGYRANPAAIGSFSAWLNDVPAQTGINILDLLYWEHRVGNWAALSMTGFDTVCDVVSPYNCRELLQTALGVDLAFRCKPYTLFRKICEIAEPRTLSLPFNDSLRQRLANVTKKLIPWRIWRWTYLQRLRLAGLGNYTPGPEALRQLRAKADG